MSKFFNLLIIIGLFGATYSFAQPSFTQGGDITVDQNSGVFAPTAWATNIVATTPVFEIVSINFVGFLTFTTDPAIDATGNLTFEATANRSGIATITVLLRDMSSGMESIPATFKINVAFINTSPTFTVSNPDQVIDEKDGPQVVLAWASDISAGPNPDEVTQDINFKTTVDSLTAFMSFAQAPKVDKSGTLTYEVNTNANGSATITIALEDDGSNTPPNSNESSPVTFTITVNPINDLPSFTIGDNITVDEHTGAVSISNWATNISAGPPEEEVSQSLTFVINTISTTTFLAFDTPVSVAADGTLSFVATPHANGVAIFEIFLLDDGPSTPPHNNKSLLSGFSITVDFINDAPSFVKGGDIVVDEGDDLMTIPNWATSISPGESLNEQDQELRFSVVFQQVTGSLAFLVPPTIDVSGELVFRATEHTHGEAIFDVFLIDDGDFDPPHENQSPVQSFIITVSKVNFPPNDIILNNTVILEKQPAGTYVGSFSTADLDPEDVHNYALVPGEGSEDNASFALDGEDLLTNEEFDFNTKTEYTIRVKTSDGEFSLEKSFNITIEKLIEGIKFANAITPNGDDENDTWELEDIEAFPDVTVFIYDRAGLNVYKSKQGYTPWDGTHNGNPLPMGTYYYVIDLNDNVNVYKGTITIIL